MRSAKLGRLFPYFFLIVFAWVCGSGCNNSSGVLLTPPPTPAVLKGQYALLLRGFDAAGNPMGIAGSITADGLGHIMGGSVEVNDDLTISSSNAPLAGSYTFDTNARGFITLTGVVGSVPQPLGFAFSLKGDGTAAEIISFDANNFITAGTLLQQDKTAFSLASLAAGSGAFAFEFDSDAPSRSNTVGRFVLSANGASTSGLADASVAGSGPTATAAALVVSLAAAGPDGNGRGTMSMSESGANTNYVYYVVNAGKFLAVQTDSIAPNQPRTGVAEKQSLPFSAATVNTTGSVFALAGFDTTAAAAISGIGRLVVSGSNLASLLWDTDDAGAIFSQRSATGQAVTFDPAAGRGTIALASGSANGLFDQAVFYLTDSGAGFALDASAGTNNRALTGRLEAQTVSGAFVGGMLSGTTIFRSVGRLNLTGLNEQEAAEGLESKTAILGNLAVNSIGDFTGQLVQPAANLATSSTQAFVVDANTGRGTLTFGSNTNVIYIVAPKHYVLIDETPPPFNSLPIEFFDPQ